ncbi:hybrid sensor histidine kinase/response regulator [Burkholderia pseudomultivorans]|uniref:histidine kinase n=1 Tax=Burkholderia pseudomultivorans TaxID=1207504 RepID=A0ABU2E214_9BURK|nr:ATP-binding protein [Burkholderia pseudomultivorans]MDR8731496.1 Sensor histidine kinase RcsC [Burkholderia pseudomultivorans]MDR8734313.1 Sensor histidine kinase RcsC [Burkholderia pseudomultivorans]MDR8742283.1 Sensor histidine kinase RcsC [Burkholderia pseudomultivorans]MDR8753618.1 Sensor histidine kinase RcsC [Burkholderia pseudomultivorans]MDR8775719.1 Sensor histidine kinase RcsC [Burkholderia pseudomultivorans]
MQGLCAAICIAMLCRVAFAMPPGTANDAQRPQATANGAAASDTAGRVACATLTAGMLAAGFACMRMRRELARARAALHATRHALAVTGHELRTPLHAMVALVDLVRDGALTTEQRRLLTLVHDSGESLSRLLDDIGDAAHVEAGRVAVSRGAVEPRVLLDDVFALLAPQARAKGLQLRQRVSAAVPAVLRTDGDRVRQILVNLLGNAIKFTASGTVTLDADATACMDGEVTWIVTIADTGGGIAEHVWPHLVEPDAKGLHGVRRDGAGAGLGLAISRQLAALLDGELSLTNEPGTGTTTTLRLRCPVVVAHRSVASLAGRAMVVEHHDAWTADVLRAYAAAAGMRVVACDAASDAIWVNALPGAAAVRVELREPGYARTSVRLGCDPLAWCDFVEACNRACTLQPEADTEPAADARHSPGDGCRVLVVDDHALHREALQRRLEQIGHRVTACGSARAALDALESGAADVDVVITDCLMPGMDGAALTHALRTHARPHLRSLPVVGLTALADDRRGMGAGMAACLRKPVDAQLLRATLDTAMRAAHRRDGVAPRAREAAATVRYFDAAALDDDVLLLAFGISSRPDSSVLDILALCRRSLSDDRDALANALRDDERIALRRWCHTASGTFSLFRQPHVDALVDGLRASAAFGDARAIRAAGAEMMSAMDYLIAHVERLAASVERPGGVGQEQRKGGEA